MLRGARRDRRHARRDAARRTPRALPAGELAALRAHRFARVEVEPDPAAALARARALAGAGRRGPRHRLALPSCRSLGSTNRNRTMSGVRERVSVFAFARSCSPSIVGLAFAAGLARREDPAVIAASVFGGVHDFFHSGDVDGHPQRWRGVFVVRLLARDRRTGSARTRAGGSRIPFVVALATLLGASPPFLGPLIYMLFRPPEYLEDVRERELEIRAIEQRLEARPALPGLPRATSSRTSSSARSARRSSARRARAASAPLEPTLAGLPVLRDAGRSGRGAGAARHAGRAAPQRATRKAR